MVDRLRHLTMSYFKFCSNNLDTLSGLWPLMFAATIASRIQASVALFVSKCVSILANVFALKIGQNQKLKLKI